MRIKATIQPQHKQGDTKSLIKFALLPHRIADVRIWLERYEVLFVYKVEKITGTINGKLIEFEIGNWVRTSERTI